MCSSLLALLLEHVVSQLCEKSKSREPRIQESETAIPSTGWGTYNLAELNPDKKARASAICLEVGCVLRPLLVAGLLRNSWIYGHYPTPAPVPAGSVHSAHPWYTQVGVLDMGATRNKQAFLK